MSRNKNWFFTINNYQNVVQLVAHFELLKDKFKYLVMQEEEGEETHTPHLQGMVQFHTAKSMSAVKTFLVQPAHVEVTKNVDKSREYCMKDETRAGGRWEIGEYTKPNPGKRTDLEHIQTMIQSGSTMRDIAEQHFGTFVTNHRGIAAAMLLLQPSTQIYQEKQVVMFWGPPRSGKSRFVTSTLNVKDLYIKDVNTKWWDGYAGQDTILLDEWPGKLSASEWKIILGEVQVPLETKGGTTRNNVKTIYITSNYSVESIFENARQVDRVAVQQRIDETYYIENRERDFLPFLLKHSPANENGL